MISKVFNMAKQKVKKKNKTKRKIIFLCRKFKFERIYIQKESLQDFKKFNLYFKI